MATNGCIVHSRKNVSNFHAAVRQVRRENKLSNNVHQGLPKRCCSCKGRKGSKTIKREILREMREDTLLKFRFSSNMNRFLLAKEEEETDDEGSNNLISPTGIASRSTSSRVRRTWGDHVRGGIRYQNTSFNQEYNANEFLKISETFQATTATDGCILHNSKYQSKFNNAVNLIRRGKNYAKEVYNELPKRCCSCHGKTGLNVIDLNVLISICEEIQSKRPKSSYDLTLSYEPESDFRQRRARLGRFIGKKGHNLKILQEKYNVLIHINDDNRIGGAFTSEIGREDTNDASKLQMVVRSKHKLIRGAIPIDKIKQEIDEIWEEASETRLIQKQFTFDQNQFQFVSLSFESGLSSEDQSDITGRFIGKKGENLRNLEDEYNIRLHLINHQSSNRKYFQKLIEVQENQPDVFYLFITKKDKSITDEFSIEEIKEKNTSKMARGNNRTH